ncbi:RhuM family protein [Thiocapsa bogorovii]|uniref:RhuM family protein n=1 Tax=Thiocapsa bogorovii TaxID=521689 RepID=UPI001E5A56B1|nr:RhuM family protein [Thiocapsa bogorovii]UHD15224.1 virulence RhuM family protein [Thiocapsa bogorovii]
MSNTPDEASRSGLVLYEAPDGAVRVEVRLHGDTVWLTQAQMAELFGRERSVVTTHVQNVFREGELGQDGNVQILHIAGSDKPVGFYSLDVIISVGYRVKSPRGTQFRIWATRVLRDHLVQGYSMNQARLRDLGQAVRLITETAQRRAVEGGRDPARVQRDAGGTDPDDCREPARGEGHPGPHPDASAGRWGLTMTTDTTERGIDRLICAAMTGSPCEPGALTSGPLDEPHADYGVGWMCGRAADYDREYCVDLAQLAAFLQETKPEVAAALDLHEDGPARRKFLAGLQGEITRRGTIDVLRHGIKHGPHHIDHFYGTPSPGNAEAAARNKANRFSVTRQLRYSRDETQLALDLCLFINDLPVATFELKNRLTKQTVEDAVQQYKRDRDPRERLFELGRCVVHFAVDDHEVRFCTQLKGKASWFLPFNLGWNDGAGNPPNPNGLKTDYLWRRILTPAGLTDILENYAQVVEIKEEETDPNKLHDLKAALDGYQVYMAAQIADLVQRYLGGPSAMPSIRFSTPAWPSTETSSTRTARSTSKARPRRSCGPTDSSPRSCPTPMPTGRSSRSSSPFSCPSCPPPSRRTSPRASSKRSTWTATGSRSRRP